MKNFLAALVLLLVPAVAAAQSQPFGVFGVDLTANNSQTTAASGHLRLRYNSGTGFLELSIATGAYDTVLTATNTVTGITNKTFTTATLTTPVVSGGLTASGSGSNDFSGSSGTFKTSTGTSTVSGSLIVAGGTQLQGNFRPVRRTVADINATVSASADYLIAYTSISAARVVSVACTGGSATQPQLIEVKDESGSASGTNTITVTPSAGTIDGAASLVCVNSARGSCRFYTQGTNCFTW